MLGVPGFDPEPYFIVLVSMIYIYRYIIFHEYYIILFDAFQRLTDDFPSKPYLGISWNFATPKPASIYFMLRPMVLFISRIFNCHAWLPDIGGEKNRWYSQTVDGPIPSGSKTTSWFVWVNFITTSLFSRALGIMVDKGNHPQMAVRFRLVKYYNLPRFVVVHHLFTLFTLFTVSVG